MMKVVAFNGSPRRGGNTEALLNEVLKPIEQAGIETELIQIGGQRMRGCTACGACFEKKDQSCIIDDDMINDCIAKAVEADGIVLGSPTYFTDVSAEMKAFIDRLGFVAVANGGMLRRKLGAAVVAVRRGGGIHVFDTINHLFQMSQMILVGSTYWNLGYGLDKGDVKSDDEGLRNMADLGETIAWLLPRLRD